MLKYGEGEKLNEGELIGVCTRSGRQGLWRKHTVLKVTRTQIMLSNGIRYLKSNGICVGDTGFRQPESLMSIEDTDRHNKYVEYVTDRIAMESRLDKVVDAFKSERITVEQLTPHILALEAMFKV